MSILIIIYNTFEGNNKSQWKEYNILFMHKLIINVSWNKQYLSRNNYIIYSVLLTL